MADTEQLVVQLEARIRDFEKNMLKAEKTASKSFSGMTRGSSTASKQMETDMIRASSRINQSLASTSSRVGTFGKAFGSMAFAGLTAAAGAAAASVLSLNYVIDRTRQALDQFGKIADSSAAAGLDPEMFQELAYQASLAGVEFDTLSSALQTFSKNSGLAVAGKGKMIKTLQALNPLLLENIRHAKDQEERVRLAADAISKAGSASEKAALSTALFGDSGTRLVSVFDGGSAAMDRTAAAAQQLGIIIDRDMIARSDELGDQMDTVSQIINNQLSQAFVALGPILASTAEWLATVAMGLGSVVDRWQDLENMTGRGLEMRVKTLGMEDLELERKILEKQAEAADVSPLASSLGFGADSAVVQKEISELVAQRAENARQQTEIMKILSDRDKAAAAGLTRPKPVTVTPVVPDLPATASAPRRDKAAEDALRQAEAVKKLIDNLEFEQSQVGMTAGEIEKSNALRQAGAAATEEQRARIIALIDATNAEADAIKRAQEDIEFAKDATKGFLSTMREGLVAGESFWKSFGNAALGVLDKIIDKLESQLVDALFAASTASSGSGSGGILGIIMGGISALFGGTGATAGAAPAAVNNFVPGTNAMGTDNWRGGPTWVGERGPEIVNLPRGSQVIPNHRVGAAGAANQNVHVSSEVVVSVDDAGKLQAYVAKTAQRTVKSGIQQYDKHVLPDSLQRVAKQPRARGTSR